MVNDTVLEDQNPGPRPVTRGRPSHLLQNSASISTLDPNKLQLSDYIDLSTQTSFDLQVSASPGKCRFLPYVGKNLADGTSMRRFPQDCRGFFYFHRELLSGISIPQSSIRFRLASGPNRSDFQSGKDFKVSTDTSSRFWELNIWQLIVPSSPYKNLLAQLESDGLITQDEIRFCEDIIRKHEVVHPTALQTRIPFLNKIDDPFIFHLEASHMILYLRNAHNGEFERYKVYNPFYTQTRPPAARIEGKCLLRLEPLSEGEAGCAVRILKLLSQGQTSMSHGLVEDTLVTRNGKLAIVELRTAVQKIPLGSRLREVTSTRATRISTLDLSKVVPSDMKDISGKKNSTLSIASHGLARIVGPHIIGFPPNSRGYLYFHQPHGGPAIAGELRFRLVDGPEQDPLRSGQDLISPRTGFPWREPIIGLASRVEGRSLVKQLLADGLVTQEDIDVMQQITSSDNWPSRLDSKVSLIFGTGYPFLLSSSTTSLYLINIDRPIPSIHRTHVLPMLKRAGYTGKYLVQLEAAPRRGPKGRMCFYLRVLEIIEPSNNVSSSVDKHVVPVRGEYLLTPTGKPISVGGFKPPIC